MKVTVPPIVLGALCIVTKGLVNGLEESGNNPNFSIAVIRQNTEKSRGDLKRLIVTYTPVIDHQLNYCILLFASFLHKIVSICILRPTSVRMWHKDVFKVGPVAGPKPNATGSSKNVSDPVGIPLFWGASGAGR